MADVTSYLPNSKILISWFGEQDDCRNPPPTATTRFLQIATRCYTSLKIGSEPRCVPAELLIQLLEPFDLAAAEPTAILIDYLVKENWWVCFGDLTTLPEYVLFKRSISSWLPCMVFCKEELLDCTLFKFAFSVYSGSVQCPESISILQAILFIFNSNKID